MTDLNDDSSGSDRIKDKILEQALQAFALTGFDGVTIASIAKKCDVSTALVHYHFSSKAALWQEAISKGVTDAIRELQMADEDMADVDPITRFKIFIRRYVNYMHRRTFIFWIIVKESDSQSERYEWLRDTHLKQYYGLWSDRIAELRAANLLRIDAPDHHIALVAIGACLYFITRKQGILPLYGDDPSDPAIVRRHADLVVDFIVAGLTRLA